ASSSRTLTWPSSHPQGASTDCGNVSHCIPTAHPVYSLGVGARNHTREFAEDANSEKAQEPTQGVQGPRPCRTRPAHRPATDG
ncbi:hypothetical protein MTO96_050264, partial [Rhipicephalus appendiculatus]